MIEQMLDQLAEFQAQRDLLEMRKANLLNSVKVPDEVIAAQDEANRKRKQLDDALATIRAELNTQARADMDAIQLPELPEEYKRALEAARAARYEIELRLANELEAANGQAYSNKLRIDADLTVKTAAIFAQLENRKREIADEFGEKAQAVDANIASLTAEIKQAVKEHGKTVKGAVFQAVYVKGRVTWNTDMLDGMIVAFPALARARKEGEPSVTLRKN